MAFNYVFIVFAVPILMVIWISNISEIVIAKFKTRFSIQKDHLNLCMCLVNSQCIFCNIKTGIKWCKIYKTNFIQLKYEYKRVLTFKSNYSHAMLIWTNLTTNSRGHYNLKILVKSSSIPVVVPAENLSNSLYKQGLKLSMRP